MIPRLLVLSGAALPWDDTMIPATNGSVRKGFDDEAEEPEVPVRPREHRLTLATLNPVPIATSIYAHRAMYRGSGTPTRCSASAPSIQRPVTK